MTNRNDEVYLRVSSALETDLAAYPDADLSAPLGLKHAAAVSIRRSFFKKLLPSGHDDSCDAAALEKFLSINSATARFVLPPNSELLMRFYGAFSEAISHLPDDCGVSQLYDRLGCGPGASRKVRSDHLLSKLAAVPSCSSPGLFALYKSCVAHSGGLTLQAELDRTSSGSCVIVRGNRLFFVPKNSVISRTCCTENLIDMMFQKAIGWWLEYVLDKCFGLRLSTEPEHNQRLARIGSIYGSLGTIDLTSASDSEAWVLVQRLFASKRAWLGLIASCRSPVSVLPDGSSVDLGMVSTMGNGFTFPLQTLTFACAVRAVYDQLGIPFRVGRARNWGVFGDDIVVEASAFSAVSDLLHTIGFEVNRSKSYNDGVFRESCGADFHNGCQIRGVYVRTLETLPDRYSAYNRVVRFSAQHELPLYNTIEELSKRLSDHVVPFFEDDCAGKKVSYATAQERTKRHGPYRQIAYRRLVFEPVSHSVTESLKRYRSESLVGLVGIHGDFRTPSLQIGKAPEPRITINPRNRPGRWRTGIGFTPYWDYAGDTPEGVFRSWKATVDLLSF